MTRIEDELRDLYRAVTDQVTERDVPGLYAKRRRRAARFAPLAAAAAVVVAIAAGLAVPKLVGSPGQPAEVKSGSASVSPPFMLVMKAADDIAKDRLAVLSAATGRVTSTVPQPRKGSGWYDTAITGSGTRFVLAARPAAGNACQPTYLYTLTLSATGAPASLKPWTVPAVNAQLTTMAVSADGKTLAYTSIPCHGGSAVLGVITGHTVRTLPGADPVPFGVPSLSADGSVLAYVQRGPGAFATARLLYTSSAAPSTFLFGYPANVLDPQVVLSQDGTAAYVFWSNGTDHYLTGYGIEPGGVRPVRPLLFHEAIPNERDLVWAGDRLFLWGGERTYLVNPANGKLTWFPALWLEHWDAVWW
jgi:hypothetical protein